MKVGLRQLKHPISSLNVSEKVALYGFLSALYIAVISVGIALFFDRLTFHRFQEVHLEALSNILSNTSVAAIRFNDPDAANENLLAIADEDGLCRIQLFQESGELFASYQTDCFDALKLDKSVLGFRRSGSYLRNTFPIQFNNRVVGYGLIEVSGERIGRETKIKTLWSLLVVPFAIFIVWFNHMKFKAAIINPIRQLASISTKISNSKDFTLRVQKKYSDEIGELVDNFNNMLSQIEEQDQQLQHANRFLENQIYERTKDLVEAVQDAQKALKAKSRFLSTMSHELRTPMNAVVGMSSLINTDGLDAETIECIEIIKKSSVHLGSMIDDILDFSKMEAGKLELDKHAFALSSCIEDAVDVCNFRFQKKSVQVVVDIKSDLPSHIIGDETRLRQVMINLIGNAIKFTHDGFVTVVARKDMSRKGGEFLKIVVSDTGIGIPDDVINNLFHDFVQADSSTTRSFGGTGLGLAISKQLVEAMGGNLCVKSSPGLGSDFWIEIPFEVLVSQESVQRIDFTKISYSCEECPEIIRDKLHDFCCSLGMRKHDPSFGENPTFLFKPALGTNLHSFVPQIEETLSKSTETNLIYICTSSHLSELQEIKGINSVSLPLNISQIRKTIESIPVREYRDLLISEEIRFPILKEKKILLVEDNRMNIKVVELMLGRFGLTCESVMNGQLACERVMDGTYDLVLMDYQMPVMDGLEATRQIRAMNLETQPWVVALTANVEERVSKELFQVGVNSYISKPIEKSKMVRILQNVENWLKENSSP